MTHTPTDIIAAHQYLYYVLARPVWSDYDYDRYCRANGIEGGGGSDRASDYDPLVRTLAHTMHLDPLAYPVPLPHDDECI